MANTNFNAYLEAIKKPFQKLCRLRFLNPDGSVAFAIDNNTRNKFGKTFISDGNISVNLQNGQRRSASVTLSNVNQEFDYNVNNIWFGQEIALDEGIIFPNGNEYYIQQGVFVILSPSETVSPNSRTIQYELSDKWAMLDGRLYGNLEGAYEAKAGNNIFQPVVALLQEDRGNGQPVDRIMPVFTTYYNGMKQTLSDGTQVNLTDSPYTLTVDASGTIASVILGFSEMLNAWVGYDASGALRFDASQDDIKDNTKPIQWTFSQNETTLLGLTYEIKNTEVYNDYIVVGEQMDDYAQPSARVQNYDGKSDTNINIIGRKTYRHEANGYATETMCKDLAVWKMKRATVLQRAVTVSASQVLHLSENNLIEVQRTDKPNNPIERHLIQGFSRPLAGTGQMTINCISVNDFPDLTVTVAG